MADISGLSGLGSVSFGSIANAMDKISGSRATQKTAESQLVGQTEKTEESSFTDILSDAISNSEELDDLSGMDTLTLLSGNHNNLSDLLINSEKSELAVNLTVSLRNKAIAAYKEIMNMQV